MNFNYDDITKEYVCSECSERYDKYNSFFKHYQRNHSKKTNNDAESMAITDSSRDNSMNNEINEDILSKSLDKRDNKEELSMTPIGGKDEKIIENSGKSVTKAISSRHKPTSIAYFPHDKQATSIDRRENKRTVVAKKDFKTAFNIALVAIGILLIGMLYSKGFFNPLLENFGLVKQTQRSIFI